MEDKLEVSGNKLLGVWSRAVVLHCGIGKHQKLSGIKAVESVRFVLTRFPVVFTEEPGGGGGLIKQLMIAPFLVTRAGCQNGG